MGSHCDGKKCSKCLTIEHCECLINWPDELERDEEKFYYNDEE